MRGDDVVCNIGPLSGRTYHKKIEPLLPQTKVACGTSEGSYTIVR